MTTLNTIMFLDLHLDITTARAEVSTLKNRKLCKIEGVCVEFMQDLRLRRLKESINVFISVDLIQFCVSKRRSYKILS